MIDEAALRAAYADLRARVAYLEKASGLFADDASLDRPKGDPKVNFSPKAWRGPNFVGKNFSQCTPDFLEALADALTWAADNPKPGADPKFIGWNRLDAARARSWARRVRSQRAAAPANHSETRGTTADTAPGTKGQDDFDAFADDNDDPFGDEDEGAFG
jgi:hypothetical protein